MEFSLREGTVVQFEIKKVFYWIKFRREGHFSGDSEQGAFLEVYLTYYLEFSKLRQFRAILHKEVLSKELWNSSYEFSKLGHDSESYNVMGSGHESCMCVKWVCIFLKQVILDQVACT